MTGIDQFAHAYDAGVRPIDETIDRWVLEKRVEDFLGARILGGVMIADLMVGDRLVDIRIQQFFDPLCPGVNLRWVGLLS